MTLLTRIVFGGASLLLLLLALGLVFLGVGEALRAVVSPDHSGVDALLDVLGYVIVAIAVFDVAKYPKATFVSTSLTAAPAGTPGGATHMLKGTLDLHGVQKEITIPVVAEKTAEGVRTKSEFTINRQDWGISYKGAADDLIKDNVLIKLDLMFPPPPAS